MKMVTDTFIATNIIVAEVLDLIRKHKRVAFLIIIFEIWIHGLFFQHLTELKEILELIPFVGKLLQ